MYKKFIKNKEYIYQKIYIKINGENCDAQARKNIII